MGVEITSTNYGFTHREAKTAIYGEGQDEFMEVEITPKQSATEFVEEPNTINLRFSKFSKSAEEDNLLFLNQLRHSIDEVIKWALKADKGTI